MAQTKYQYQIFYPDKLERKDSVREVRECLLPFPIKNKSDRFIQANLGKTNFLEFPHLNIFIIRLPKNIN